MDKRKIYAQLINRAKGRTLEGYSERHHIAPNFLFADRGERAGVKGHLPGDYNAKSNVVRLTAREHFLAHMLLAKIYKSTHYEYAAVSSLNLMLNKTANIIHRHAFIESIGKSRLYSRIRNQFASTVSEKWKGTIVAKDFKSGKMIGHVSVDHPNVKAGKWVHHTKGTTISAEHRKKISAASTGLSNGNSKGYSDAELLESYIACSEACKFIAPVGIWHGWAKKTSAPYIKHFKDFRFDGLGFAGMRNLAISISGLKYDPKGHRRLDTKSLYESAKNKWL